MNTDDFSLKHLVFWLKAERPIDWQKQFGRETILEVEIGFGYGDFLVQLSQKYPGRNFVGLELRWVAIRKGLRNIVQAKAENVRLMQADARIAFDRLFLPQSLHRVYALFSDPWPKKRHAKHRLFSHDFLMLLNSRLVRGGEAHIITDSQPYLSWILEQVDGIGFEVHRRSIPPRFGTKYERKWHESGQREFHELWLIKRAHVDIPLKEDILLRTYYVDQFNPERFHPLNERGDTVTEFKEFLYDPKRHKGMVMVVVAEENLTQHFWIEIGQKQGRWYIRPSKGCEIVPTTGVQRALDLVRDAAHQ